MIPPIEKLYARIKNDGHVLDVGCFGFAQVELAKRLGLLSLHHSGVDYCEVKGKLPPDFIFRKADLSKEPIPFEDDQFDLVVASHIIEHVKDPINLFGECARVCKPGGYLYFEAPSERSLLLPSMPFEREKFFSLSFFDDPTHLSRPWPPQSFFRLARYYSFDPLDVGYLTSVGHRVFFPFRFLYALITKNGKLLELSCRGALGWASFLIAQKPVGIKGRPEFNYYIPADR